MANLFLLFLIIAAAVHTGLCLRCFNCNSRANPKCADPLDESRVVYQECTKSNFRRLMDDATREFPALGLAFNSLTFNEETATCQKLVINYGDDRVMFRSCKAGKHSSLEECQSQYHNITGTIEFCEQCDSALCNQSANDSAHLSILLMTSIFSAIVVMK